MERKELLGINGKIFIGQGQAIQKNAASDVRVLVVGNPCNTNCLIAMNNAKEIPRDRWFAMTRLDENRARAQLAHKAGIGIRSVTNMTIWGNHSSTQYPDFYNARIDGRPANEVIGDEKWLKEDFIATVQQRGAAVIKARGLSSAGSAANAVVDTVYSLTNDTPGDDWHSVAVCSDGSYDVEKGLISSFPVRVRGGKLEIVQRLPINDFSRAKINASVAELKEEKSLVAELMWKIARAQPSRFDCVDCHGCREDQACQAYFAKSGLENLAPEIGAVFCLHHAIVPVHSRFSVITWRQTAPGPRLGGR